jgi:hypothetical protein
MKYKYFSMNVNIIRTGYQHFSYPTKKRKTNEGSMSSQYIDWNQERLPIPCLQLKAIESLNTDNPTTNKCQCLT